MSGQGQVQEGMQVYGVDEQMIGRVKRVHGGGFDVAGFRYSEDSVVRVEHNRVYVQGVGMRETAHPGEATELAGEGEIRVPVVEEQLQVGKREVDLGEVEIRRRVVEEQRMVPVTLRREEVTVQEVDTPDRPLRPGEDVFSEGTIRVAVHGEEAVVAKEAIVTGEVVVEKGVETEQRQVSDTVRRTEVEFDDTTRQARSAPAADTTPHYQAGYAAGTDKRYADREFEEVEPELRQGYQTSGAADDWAQLREEVRNGFTRARGK